ncbi:MAG: hypothetical protein OXD47_10060 [Gammaproteobacteria bacterium]|nr:hypothetical protein [Gammaproteobacteria bacterium]MCY4211584.1 hypothetical protein [Gammaproteobacteria bacterium]MCY4282675.1 hypothetical protein [Gammaproteobacteria bacterium]MCY4339127.1 hypothetical protein [Gammaproteobacteria bacterium]
MTGANEQYERLPEALIEELKHLDRAPDVITPRVDRRLASLAHAQFAQRRLPRWQPRRVWRAAAAACVLVVVLFTTNHVWEQDNTSIYADIDGSGQIDIADVLALARAEDGVNQTELDAFAYRLVALDRAGT